MKLIIIQGISTKSLSTFNSCVPVSFQVFFIFLLVFGAELDCLGVVPASSEVVYYNPPCQRWAALGSAGEGGSEGGRRDGTGSGGRGCVTR